MKHLRRYRLILAIALYLFAVESSFAPEIFWSKWVIDASGNGADGIHTGDINRDGRIDVVSGWEQSGELMLYLNPGPGRVRDRAAWSRIDISGGLEIHGIEDAAFADLNLDGIDDAVVSSIEGDTKSLGLHWLSGEHFDNPEAWQGINLAPTKNAGYMKARAGQIDGVGGADIVAGTKSMDGQTASIYWFKSPDTAATDNTNPWRRFLVGELNVKTVTLVIKDMDADSLADIVYSGRNGLGWFKNPGKQALAESPGTAYWERIVIADRGSEFTFCDHTVDGMEDIIATTSHDSGMVAKWLKRLDASGRRWAEYPIASDRIRTEKSSVRKFVLKGVACGYVDGDDKIDVVFTGSGDGHGVFMMSPRTDISSGVTWDLVNIAPYTHYMKFDNLKLVDIDDDGDLDIFTTEEGEGVLSRGEGVLWFENPRNSATAGLDNSPELSFNGNAELDHIEDVNEEE